MVREAVNSLGRLRAEDSVGPLSQLILPTTDSNIRNMIAKALGKIGGDASVNVLLSKYELLDPITVNSAFIRMGLFDAVLRKQDANVDSRDRRQLRIAMKISHQKLKVLVENNSLSESEIRRALSQHTRM